MENLITNIYEVTQRDEIVIILFKSDVFELLCNRSNSESLFEILNNLKRNHNIKALLFTNKPGCLGDEIYDKFLKKIMFEETISNYAETLNFAERKIRIKEITILNRFVKYIKEYNKLTFTALTGSIVTPFFGLTMATDIRYLTPEAHFSLAHNKHGLHPSGGLPYFLGNQLGQNKAIELLFSKKVTAAEALELGLINKVIKEDNFLDNVVNEIKMITRFNESVLNSTKTLTSNTMDTLSNYFDFEETYKP